ncbi:hypothetical protein KOR42_23930 [Thalassoglobus neptunius]|uniref:Uncharacterized protein n=1 Tax=Thalassoglobus neptunius TaxID=1938619 RepID=A0A5C5X7H9_9PLAN|nr:hypothetical protein KOR42_23930 [Thalassoglobus neptunius]
MKKQVHCCDFCGRDTPNKSRICKFCTSGSERFNRKCDGCKNLESKCVCPRSPHQYDGDRDSAFYEDMFYESD